jgi:hypothetical protein
MSGSVAWGGDSNLTAMNAGLVPTVANVVAIVGACEHCVCPPCQNDLLHLPLLV